MGSLNTSNGGFNFRVSETRRKLFLMLGLVFFFLLTLLAFRRQDRVRDILSNHLKPGLDVAVSDERHVLPARNLKDLRNRTLGFENVYVINMPARTDKLDAMKLTASLTGFDFDIIEGVSGADLPKKALPGTFKDTPGVNGVIGCWRSHMNFAKTIIEKQISTALVIEDDADWDVGFRLQLENFAVGSQFLSGTPASHVPRSPYGDDWDMLWLGHCANQPFPGDERRVLVENDPTVTPYVHRTNFAAVPDMTRYDNTTRIIYPSNGGTCTYAYALSYRGAQKVLFHLSMNLYASPVDWGLHDMCDHPERGFKCISVFPQLVDTHRSAGTEAKDSDIGRPGLEPQVRHKGMSFNIVHSTRLNVPHLIANEMDKIESQWPGEIPELSGPVKTSFRTKFPW